MATYAIGDVQGCRAELEALLATVGWSPARDRLVFVGDLVNRGPDSLGVLRLVHGLGARAVCVLGNHDLHLLAVAEDPARRRRQDTLDAVLAAPDRATLLAWLRRCPLLHREPAHGVTVVHAGLPPQWSVDLAEACAGEVQAVLAGPRYRDLLARMYGHTPACWSERLRGWSRLRFTINSLTRLRFCDPAGALALAEKGAPGTQAPHLQPWFAVPERASSGTDIVFGHWSTLRLSAPERERYRVHPLDSGCVWGGRMTALRLEDRRLFSVPSQQPSWSSR